MDFIPFGVRGGSYFYNCGKAILQRKYSESSQ
jgi:hypothetical protein